MDRFEPAERGSDWFVADSMDFRGELRPALGATGDWGYKPLVAYRDGEEFRAVIRHQVFAHLGAALVVAERLRFGVSLPVLAYQKSRAAIVNGTLLDPSDDLALGDLRLSAAVNLLGAYRAPFALGAGLWGYVPTGSREGFTGDGAFRLAPHVMAAGDLGQGNRI